MDEPREAPLPPTPLDAISEPKKRAYLVALSRTGIILRACSAAGISHALPWVWRQDDAGFVALEAQARKLGAERLVQEAYRRAVEGVDKPIYYEGKRIDTLKEYSDILLIFLLKGALPDVYKERREISGDQSRPLTVQLVQFQEEIHGASTR